jgi:hypothetical protein
MRLAAQLSYLGQAFSPILLVRGPEESSLELVGPQLDSWVSLLCQGCPFCLHKVPDQALLCRQPNECIKTLADMKVTLKELCWLLQDERRGLTELQQQFAKAKATWETERAELKGHASQVSLPAC